ncbi:unnamed protein product, partial [Onchocerca ochengi]|uniref:TPX2 domain-containing protein n=1 Tax=Onchocerca ochengi TaxID=42157 RepID=A0A182EWW9_ONCOC
EKARNFEFKLPVDSRSRPPSA